jgi:chromosome segregation ATPase
MLYRFKGKVVANKATKLTVKEEVIQGEELAILPMDLGALDWYSRQGEIPKDVRDTLTKAAQMKSALTEIQRQIDQKNQLVQQVTAEQARIRENMKTVNQQSEYYTRLLKKLNDQETQIESTQNEAESLRKKLEAQRTELERYLADLNVG